MAGEICNLNDMVMQELQQGNPLSSSSLPERVLQFGEGNFLRGFIDWMINEMNKSGQFNGKVVALQPTPRGRVVPKLNNQDGLYTLVLRGIDQGVKTEKIEVIHSIHRGINPYSDWDEVLKIAESPSIEFVFSNTTEAGLQYMEEEYEEGKSPLSFPAKLVALLYHRYKYFRGDSNKGWIILPCELVEKNGEVLENICKRIVENWQLPVSFWEWVESSSVFCQTLVDRIVTGYPHEEADLFEARLGYKDELLTVAEPYHLFVIEGPKDLEEKLPFKKAGLNVHFSDITSYRELKVKFLNAPHTMLSLVGMNLGIETVKEGVEDHDFSAFLRNALTLELKETLRNDEKQSSGDYLVTVFDRFLNPYLDHRLFDISLNSYAKFQSRILPSLLKYKQLNGIYPKRLVFSLAALITFYKVTAEDGDRKFGQGVRGQYEIRDSIEVIDRFSSFWSRYDGHEESTVQLVKKKILKDLLPLESSNDADNLAEEVSAYLIVIQNKGLRQALKLVDDQDEKGM